MAGPGRERAPPLTSCTPGSGLGTTFTGYKYLELGREQLLLHTTLAARPAVLGTQSALAFREDSLASSVVSQSVRQCRQGMLVDTVDKCCLVLWNCNRIATGYCISAHNYRWTGGKVLPTLCTTHRAGNVDCDTVHHTAPWFPSPQLGPDITSQPHLGQCRQEEEISNVLLQPSPAVSQP